MNFISPKCPIPLLERQQASLIQHEVLRPGPHGDGLEEYEPLLVDLVQLIEFRIPSCPKLRELSIRNHGHRRVARALQKRRCGSRSEAFRVVPNLDGQKHDAGQNAQEVSGPVVPGSEPCGL